MPTFKLPPSTLWAETFVDALIAAGLRRVVIAPGSRSTPLTLAFSRRTEIRRYAAIDERGAAFFALGMAMTDGQPAAVVCTSGTAAGEFYPAVLEAEAAEVPLLLLTADRPHELRHSGANQTTDQVKLYGGHVRWFVDVALPEKDPAPRTLRSLRSLAARALAAARGFQTPPGPVHLNFPFRKPLQPPSHLSPPPRGEGPGVEARIEAGVLHPTGEQIRTLGNLIRRNPRGVILCGPRASGGEFPSAVTALARAAGYPLLAEALSGVRFGPHGDGTVLGGYERYLDEMPTPQVVLRFGALPVGKRALDWLAGLPSETRVVQIDASGTWQDDTHRLNLLLRADPASVCREVADILDEVGGDGNGQGEWLCAWQERETTARQAQRDAWLPAVLNVLPEGGNLFVANSLAVRHLGEQVPPSQRKLHVYANRGLSGIDGTIAGAAGVAAASERPTLLLIGDLAFLHDLNSLHLLRHVETPFAILLRNDDGGGIFERLPIAAHEPPYTEFFRMPHGMTFEYAARQFGLRHIGYAQNTPPQTIAAALAAALNEPRPAVVEWTTHSGRRTTDDGR